MMSKQYFGSEFSFFIQSHGLFSFNKICIISACVTMNVGNTVQHFNSAFESQANLIAIVKSLHT